MPKTGQNYRSFVRVTISVQVLIGNEIWRIGDIQLLIAPDQTHRKSDSLGKSPSKFKNAISIAIFEQAHTTFASLSLQTFVQVRTGGICDEKAATIIESSKHGKGEDGRFRSGRDRKTFWNAQSGGGAEECHGKDAGHED